jgi:tRNA(Ile)-lysidine synthase
VERVIPNAAANVLETIERMKEAESLYNQSIETHKKKLLEYRGEEVHIPVLKFEKAAPFKTIAYEIIKDYGFNANQLPELLSLLKADTGKYIISATHRIIKNRKWLIIAPIQSAAASNLLIEEEDEIIEFESGKLQLNFTDKTTPSTERNIAALDAKHIKFPLLLRKWKTGDYFYPLGMPKKKKVARFLIDLKLSKTDKEKVWVIESNQKIIWVVGYRIDDRFKLNATTKKVLRLKLIG